jgi:hypothetical protein
LQAEQHRRDRLRDDHADDRAGDDACGHEHCDASQYEADDPSRCGTKRHPDTDLRPPTAEHATSMCNVLRVSRGGSGSLLPPPAANDGMDSSCSYGIIVPQQTAS